MFGLRMPELLLILAVVLVLFGSTKLPQLGAALGQSIKGFKKSMSSDDDEPKALPQNQTAAPQQSASQSNVNQAK